MKRRTAIRTLSIGFGATLTASGALSIFTGCQPQPEALTFEPEFLTVDAARNINELMDIILPKTDTPGAKEVGLIEYVDAIVGNVYSPEQQERFNKGLQRFENVLQEEYDYEFDNVNRSKLEELLQDKMGDASQEEDILALLGAEEDQVAQADLADYELYRFLGAIKSLAISGYFSSQLVAEEYLSYDPIPGAYQGCIPVDDVGNAWAL